MILVILGAQKSPPNTYFFVLFFLKITYWSKLKPFIVHMFYNEFTSPIHTNHTPKNNEKTNKIQTPLHVTENRPSSKTSVFVTYLPPKSNDWTPPRDAPQVAPKGPKTYPGSSRDPPELSEGPPGPPGRPGSQETLRKPTKKQIKSNETSKNH